MNNASVDRPGIRIPRNFCVPCYRKFCPSVRFHLEIYLQVYSRYSTYSKISINNEEKQLHTQVTVWRFPSFSSFIRCNPSLMAMIVCIMYQSTMKSLLSVVALVNLRSHLLFDELVLWRSFTLLNNFTPFRSRHCRSIVLPLWPCRICPCNDCTCTHCASDNDIIRKTDQKLSW